MKEFMMLFRHVPNPNQELSVEELQASITEWQNWIGDIAAQGKFMDTNQLSHEGKTLKANQVITDGPYAELKEVVGGYILVKAASLDEALKMAEGCPVLAIGGNVEVRSIMKL